MTIIKNPSRTANRFACILFGVLCAIGLVQGEEATQIVVNTSVSERDISKNAVRAIFGMRLKAWADGTPITVFVLPDDHPAHVQFSKQVVNVFPYQLRAAWDRLVFSGTGQAPLEVSSELEMRTRVAATTGAIGYLKGATVDDQIRILQIK